AAVAGAGDLVQLRVPRWVQPQVLDVQAGFRVVVDVADVATRADEAAAGGDRHCRRQVVAARAPRQRSWAGQRIRADLHVRDSRGVDPATGVAGAAVALAEPPFTIVERTLRGL